MRPHVRALLHSGLLTILLVVFGTARAGGGERLGLWVTPSGAPCTNGPRLVPSSDACEWLPCKDDPLPSVVYYVCDTGGNDSRTAKQARNASTPWATSAHAMSQFAKLNAGEAIAFCRGGTFAAPATQFQNSNGTQANPTIVRDYTRPGRTGFGDPRPIFNGENFSAGIQPGRVKFENLAMHATIGRQSMLFDFGPDSGETTDVVACNLEISGAAIAVQFQYRKVPQELVRHSVVGSRILNSVEQGFLGHSIDGQLTDNWFWNNPVNTNPLNHTIYLDGHSGNVDSNQTTGEVVSRNEIHSVSATAGAVMVVGGIHRNLTIESNLFLFDIGSPPTASGWALQVGGSGYGPELMYTENLVIRGNTIVNAGNQSLGVATCKANCVVENNLIVNTQQWTRGINAPNEINDSTISNGITIRNNTVYTPVAGSVGISSGQEGGMHVVVNNVVRAPACFAWGTASAYSERDYNACYQGVDTPLGPHSWRGDPGWRVPGTDFTPAIGSPLIGRGTRRRAPLVDYAGKPRPTTPSIGAFEP